MNRSKLVFSPVHSDGNSKKPSRRNCRRITETHRESTQIGSEGLAPGDQVFQRITHELQRVDQCVTLQTVWPNELLKKRGSSLMATVLHVGRGYGYLVVLLSTGRPVMLHATDLADWIRPVSAAAQQLQEVA